jgi:hypothetical protein
MDLRFGGFSGGYLRNPAAGAHGTGATDYEIMPQLFQGRIRPDDVLVDVGCGKGRVINWWLSQGLANRIYGLELLTGVAESTRRRLRGYANVTIVTGDAVENLPPDGTLFFLFNPFDDNIMARFVQRLWTLAERKDITVIYFAPVHLEAFRADARWSVEERSIRLPKAGHFEQRHTRFALITPKR